MSETTPRTEPDGTVSSCPSLRIEGYTREPKVEAQIELLLHVSVEEFWRRARLTDIKGREWVQEETLVGILRAWNRRGEREAAFAIIELLLERSTRFIVKHVTVWKSLTLDQQTECIRDIQMQLLTELLDEGRSNAFWEVRFWLCLKRRILNSLHRYRTAAEHELNPEPISDEDGHTTDFFTLIADTRLSPEQRTLLYEALSLLTEMERMAFILHHYQGWGQQEIATQLQITDRTVRNLLTRAEKRLQGWRNTL